MVETRKLLAVLPHPDDETLVLGGTLAKYSAEDVETYLLCTTRGERGWNGPEEQNPGPDSVGCIREAEVRCATSQLGLHEIDFLDYLDGDVDQANPLEIIARVTTHIRRVRPQVIVTFPPDGHYGHPDHIALSQFTAAALLCAADPSFRDLANLAPFRVSKFYYVVHTKAYVDTIRELIGHLSIAVDGVERNHVGWDEWVVTTRIDAKLHLDKVWQAVLCHESQLPGYGPLLELPRESLARLFSEGTFVRVFSLVNGGRTVEYDLFEGLR